MAFQQKDNDSIDDKVALRQVALSAVRDKPVIMKTHGGMGAIYDRLYYPYDQGVVFDKDSLKAQMLSQQRPTWCVYQADVEKALSLGAGAHMEINYLDLDPYGDSWPTINAYFGSKRPFAKRMIVVVNDGLRQKIRAGGAWDSKTLEPIVLMWGNQLWDKYLDACKVLLGMAIKDTGYEIKVFEGYYTGNGKKLTHFMAILER